MNAAYRNTTRVGMTQWTWILSHGPVEKGCRQVHRVLLRFRRIGHKLSECWFGESGAKDASRAGRCGSGSNVTSEATNHEG